MKRTKLLFLMVCTFAFANTFAANRYWVGGAAGTWAATTSWSETSGGTSGATSPTTGDDVFFDNGTPTVTLGAAVTVNSITFTSSNVTFAGAYAIATTNMTVDNSQLVFVNSVNINSSLVFSGTTTAPRIKHNATGAVSLNFQLGDGGAFTLTGNTATNYFEGTSLSSFRYNTTSSLTVFFKSSTTLTGIYVYKGLITLGNDLTTVRINFADANLNNQELILAPNVTLTLNSGGSSGFTSLANGGTVNASARGSKFVMKSTEATILGGTKRIFKTGATINHFEFNSIGTTFNLFESVRVRNITKTAGTIATTASKTITVEAGGVITGAGSIGTDIIYETATTRYWVGGAAGEWLNVASWGTSSGNTTTPGIPAMGDNVVFDNSAGNENPTVTLTEPVTAADINFSSSNVTFAGPYSTTTNSMTVNSSQVQFVDHSYVNSSLTLSGTNPRITQQSTTSGRSFFFGNGDAFTLTGNSATNYFTGNTNAYYTFNTTSPLTVYFNPTITTAGALVLTKGSITLGNNVNSARLTLNSLNSQELILGENVTFTMTGGGTSNIVNTAAAGVVNASATGSKFVIASTAATFLATAGRIFKDGSTINHLEMNSSGQIFVPAYPLTVKNLTLTAGSINNSTNNITIPSGGNLVVAVGTTTAALNASLPSAPASVTATAGDGQASVAFTLANGGSLISNYKYSLNNGAYVEFSPAKSTSPIVITGLTNTMAYTVKLIAINAIGEGTESIASGSVTPDDVLNDITVATATNASALSLTPVSDVVVSKDALLTIDQLSTINSLTVAAGGQVTNSSTLTATNLTINSNEDGTGTFIDNSNSTITNAVVKQYLSSARNWYMSSPVSGSTVLPVNGGTLAFYSYPESDALQATGGNGYGAGAVWNTVNSGTMAVKNGYIVRPSDATSTLSFTGTGLNTGNQTISGITYTAANPKHGFNLIGNPYPSYINVLSAITDNANLEATVWYKTRATNGTYYAETVNATSGVGTNASGTGRVTGYIPPMQAFWVRATASAIDNPQSITLSNGNRSHAKTDVLMTGYPSTPTTPLKAPASIQATYSLLGLNVSNGTNGDEAIVMFTPDATNGMDAYDSGKMTNGNKNIPEIFTLVEGKQLAINGLGSISFDTEMQLGFTTGTAGTFSIKASQISNFETGTIVILKDNLDINQPVLTDLSDGSSYSFTSDATSNITNRFSLLFRAPGVATSVDNATKLNSQVFVNASNQITIITPEKASYSIFNAMGQQVENGIVNTKHETLNAKLNTGVYVVKVGNQSTRVIIK